MQMLLTQLTNQDPTQPMSASDMTQQMVGIQQIESQETLQQQITVMNQGAAASAANIIGKTVSITNTDGNPPISGAVTAVRQSTANGIQVVVGGNPYSMSQVTSISNS
jgi:flagellar basal-body rod modification protein FlgD